MAQKWTSGDQRMVEENAKLLNSSCYLEEEMHFSFVKSLRSDKQDVPSKNYVAAVVGVWNVMSSLEKAVFISCVLPPLERTSPLIFDVSRCGELNALEVLRHSLACRPDYLTRTGNLLLRLVGRGLSSLVVKILDRMTSDNDWFDFISSSLDIGTMKSAGDVDGFECVLHAAARHRGACRNLARFLDKRRNAVRNHLGDTPLHVAAENGHWEDLQILLEQVESLEIMLNHDGWNPLHSAASSTRPHPKVAVLLVDHMRMSNPALLNATSSRLRNTALHMAARNADVTASFVTSLKDLDPSLLNLDNVTPLELTAERKNDSSVVVAMLEIYLPMLLSIAKNNDDEDGGKLECRESMAGESDDATRSQLPLKSCSSRSLVILDDCVGFECGNKKMTMSGTIGDNSSTSLIGAVKSQVRKYRRQGSRFVNSGDDATECRLYGRCAASLVIGSVMRSCAVNGHHDALALLLRYGVDAGDVLHDLVEKSVEHNRTLDKLIGSYNTIIDSYCRSVCGKSSIVETSCRVMSLRMAVLRLIGAPRYGKNVLERAIELGAAEMLMTILNTPDVYRFNGHGQLKKDFWTVPCEIFSYDVTDMIRSTASNHEQTDLNTRCLGCGYGAVDGEGEKLGRDGGKAKLKLKPDKCYLEMMIEHKNVWRDTDVLKRHPFKKLVKSYVGFLRRVCLLVTIIQVCFMMAFTVNYLPTADRWASDGEKVGRMPDAGEPRPHWSWLVWPAVLAAYHLYALVTHLLGSTLSLLGLVRGRQRFDAFRNVGREVERHGQHVIDLIVDRLPFGAFCGVFFAWYANCGSFQSRVTYLEVLSVVFLFGWSLNFVVLSRVTKRLYIFSLVLKAVIVEHIVKHFMPVFVFTVVGFSFAFHVLEYTRVPDKDDAKFRQQQYRELGSMFYSTLVCAFGSGDLFEATSADDEYDVNVAEAGGHPGYRKVLFASYVIFTALILLNYLIALLNSRFEKEWLRAENAWRFDSLVEFMRFEEDWATSSAFGWIHRLDYWLTCFCWPRKQIIDAGTEMTSSPCCCCSGSGKSRVVVVQVQKYRPWSKQETI